MKVTTPQIVWHSKEPVFSADFHHFGECWRLATGGADKDVKIWKLEEEEKEKDKKVKIVFMASLSRHSGAVNVVRFSPNGEYLASAGDDNVVCLWKLGEGGGASGNITMDTTSQPNKETWNVTKMLRGHLEDIYDASWSGDSLLLATGSVDNTTIVWDTIKGTALYTLSDSKQYVQGVAWDPVGHYLATLSNDRSMRVYASDVKMKCVNTVSKMAAPDQEKVAGGGGGGSGRQLRMWMDESLSSFFRRLAFSPDGNLLVVPAGRYENGDNKVTNMTYVFTRSNFSRPVVCLPCPDKPTVMVRFCPKLFKLRDSTEQGKNLFNLSYRMVYAVASLDSVLFYDTQQTRPFAYISDIHYSGITDLAWSEDGLVLVITSSDAYCSIVTFEPRELGVVVETEDLPEQMRRNRRNLVVGQQNGMTSGCVDNNKKSTTPHRKTKVAKEDEGEGGGGGGGGGGREIENGFTDGRSQLANNNTIVVGAKRGAGEQGGGGNGQMKEAKGKRRITTTLVGTLNSSSSSSSSSSPSISPYSIPSNSDSNTQSTTTTTTSVPHTSDNDTRDLATNKSNPYCTASTEGREGGVVGAVGGGGTGVAESVTTINSSQTGVTTAGSNKPNSGDGKKPRRISFQTLTSSTPAILGPTSPQGATSTSSEHPKGTLISLLQSSPPPLPTTASQPSGSCDPVTKSRDQSSTHSLTEPSSNNSVEPMDVQIVE